MEEQKLFEFLVNKALEHFYPVTGNEDIPLTQEVFDLHLQTCVKFAKDILAIFLEKELTKDE